MGLHKSKDKVNQIINTPAPTNLQELRSVLGFLNFYDRFISDKATLMHPLYELLKSEQVFKWTSKCQKAFDKSKKIIASDGVLVRYNPMLQLKLYCDASNYGVASVLMRIFGNGT